MGGELIPGPQSARRKHLTSPLHTGVCAQRAVRPTEPSHRSVCTHPLAGHQRIRSAGGGVYHFRVAKGAPGGTELEDLGVGSNILCFVFILAQVSLFRLSVLGIIPEVRCRERGAEWSLLDNKAARS